MAATATAIVTVTRQREKDNNERPPKSNCIPISRETRAAKQRSQKPGAGELTIGIRTQRRRRAPGRTTPNCASWPLQHAGQLQRQRQRPRQRRATSAATATAANCRQRWKTRVGNTHTHTVEGQSHHQLSEGSFWFGLLPHSHTLKTELDLYLFSGQVASPLAQFRTEQSAKDSVRCEAPSDTDVFASSEPRIPHSRI